jgi:starch-binding outer membrane protein, SusD/RagB family
MHGHRLTRRTSGRAAASVALIALAAASATGCREYLTVENPNVVNADAIDPKADAPTLSLSARENFFWAAGWMASFSSFLVWESWPAETFPEYNQFGLRSIVNTNAVLNTSLWQPLSVALASNEKVIEILTGSDGEATNIHLARSLLFSGYSMVVMGEDFCQAVIRGGPPLTSAQILDTAVLRFTRASTIARASAGGNPAAGTEAYDIVNTALVGKARAELQIGRKADAAATARQVAAGFNYNMIYVDNPASRARLSNRQWLQTRDRATIVVPPDWRTGDPRVPYGQPGANGLPNQAADGIIPFVWQNKFRSYDAPVRLASKIEADYIEAEATGTAAMLTLIQARRSANGQPAYTGATDDASVLAEFEEQRGREFYLEGKRLGDFRRNGAAVLHVPQGGQAYFKSGYNPVGNQTCLMLPQAETDNNPNF